MRSRVPLAFALLLVLVPGGARAEARSPSAIRADIAAIDGRIRGIEKTIEERTSKDASMQRALDECDRLDEIYAGYRTRLVKAQRAVNAAHRAYREQFRLASVLWPCRAQQVWWWFCNVPALGRIGNWKWYGPYAESFTRARNDFWSRLADLEAEKQAVASELSHDTQLPSLGLGVFDDYFAFKDAYERRKAVCDATVRPYFAQRESFAALLATLEQLKTQRAQLEEELAALRGDGPPPPTAEAGDARLQILVPGVNARAGVPLQDRTRDVKGLTLGVEVVGADGVLEVGRLHRLVAELGQKPFSVYGRVQALEAQGPPILRFGATLPARLGPFTVRVSIPELPGVQAATLRGTLVPSQDAAEDLGEASKALAKARAPRPHSSPERIQRDLCQALCDVALALMRLDRIEESMRAARESKAILDRHWPTSRAWRRMRGSIWYELHWVFAQEAFARGDLQALEQLYLARAEVHRQLADEDRQGGSRANVLTHLRDLRGAYRGLGAAIVLLDDDLERARGCWRTGRDVLQADEPDAPRQPGLDPVWFAP